ncbi:hypothetical protein D3C75_1067460 [compost metagenome]
MIGPKTTPRLTAAYLRLKTSSFWLLGVMSDSRAREVGSNTERHRPFSVFTSRNTHNCPAIAKPTNTAAQQKIEISITFLRPMISEI